MEEVDPKSSESARLIVCGRGRSRPGPSRADILIAENQDVFWVLAGAVPSAKLYHAVFRVLAGAVPSAKPCPRGAVPLGRVSKADHKDLLVSGCCIEEEDKVVFDKDRASCCGAGDSAMGYMFRLAKDHVELARFCVEVLSVLKKEPCVPAPDTPTSE